MGTALDRNPASGGARDRRRRRRARRRELGLGLIELMVSAGFASVLLLGFAANTIGVARAHSVSRNAAAATALAQEQLEALRSLPLDAPAVTPGTYADPANPLRADGSTGGVFQRSWTVLGPDVPSLGLKTVTVSVGWTDYSPHVAQVSAYVRCSTVPCS